MKVNYFEHEGKKYYAGTEFETLEGTPKLRRSAVFLWHDPDEDLYAYRVYFTFNKSTVMISSGKLFFDNFCNVTKESDGSIGVPEYKRLKDSQIPKLVIGWVWYIVIMAFLLITTVRLAGWIIASIVFFKWREKVIKEEGYYYDWPL